jgi:4-methylaminobutanoate oxidase (formaldehyde-forming)
LADGVEVGEVRSAGYGHTLGASVALCEIHASEPVKADYIRAGSFEIDLAGTRYKATAHLRTPYDPKSERVRADI